MQSAGRLSLALSALAVLLSVFANVTTAFNFFGVSTPAAAKAKTAIARPYFLAGASDTPAGFAAARAYATPNSPAWNYASDLYFATTAVTDHDNFRPQASSVQRSGTGFRLCNKTGCGQDDGFVVDAARGTLTDYTQRGVVSSFVTGPGDTVKGCGIAIRLLGAYRPPTDELTRMTFQVDADPGRTVRFTGNEYITEDGHSNHSASWFGQGKLFPGQESLQYLAFKNDPLPGVVRIWTRGAGSVCSLDVPLHLGLIS